MRLGVNGPFPAPCFLNRRLIHAALPFLLAQLKERTEMGCSHSLNRSSLHGTSFVTFLSATPQSLPALTSLHSGYSFRFVNCFQFIQCLPPQFAVHFTYHSFSLLTVPSFIHEHATAILAANYCYNTFIQCIQLQLHEVK